jgi:predicted nucleotidyltransferase
MAAIPADVTQSVEYFLNAVRREWQIEAAYLFGSYVRGQATRWSDIDVAIVSRSPSEDLSQARLRMMRIAARVDPRIEARLFAAEDFSINDPLVGEIRRSGILLEAAS